jgi:indole-3-glycerol phosphate synthase
MEALTALKSPPMTSTLEELAEAAKAAVRQRCDETPIAVLEKRLPERDERRPFSEALRRPGLSVIAEFKRRSPSAGDIQPEADVAVWVQAYEAGGAAALSVLTESSQFGGAVADLGAARRASSLPILRKDFIVDRYQLVEAVVSGADAVLLIVSALEDDALAELYREARALELDCLVEVHNEKELDFALELDCDVIGINNRNLAMPHDVDFRRTLDLIRHVPAGKTVVSESGIAAREQLDGLEEIGVDAVLIGEALMRSPNPESAVRELSRAEEGTAEHRL